MIPFQIQEYEIQRLRVKISTTVTTKQIESVKIKAKRYFIVLKVLLCTLFSKPYIIKDKFISRVLIRFLWTDYDYIRSISAIFLFVCGDTIQSSVSRRALNKGATLSEKMIYPATVLKTGYIIFSESVCQAPK